MGYYDVAQICLNGHVTNVAIKSYPEDSTKFCRDCGTQTITQCPQCCESILGKYIETGICVPIKFERPSFCPNCGNPYPWTESALEGIKEIIDEEKKLSTSEKEKLKLSLNDIISETPKTALAVTRIKKTALSVGTSTKEALMQFVTDYAVDVVKTLLGIN